MRYFEINLGENAEYIEENARIKYRDYPSQKVLDALNNYLYKTLKNGLYFFSYREEENSVLSAFSYDEKSFSYDEALDSILGILAFDFQVKHLKESPYEITMYRFLDDIMEGRRRDYVTYHNKIIDSNNLWMYSYYHTLNEQDLHYDFNEMIVSEKYEADTTLYDRSFSDELKMTHIRI